MKPGPDRSPAPKGRPFQTHSLQIILFGPFTYEPNVVVKNRGLTIGAVCGKACALAQMAVESSLYQAEVREVSSISNDMQLLL